MTKNDNDVLAFFKAYSETEDVLDEFRTADQLPDVTAISTGSISLDTALCSGGYPRGRITQLYGGAGSGKTCLAMIGIFNAQKDDPEAKQVWLDAEQTFNSSWAETLGIDTKKIVVVSGEKATNGRECFELLLGVPKEDIKTHVLVGKKKEGLLDKIAKKELNINFIVLDSLGAIIPPIEDTAIVGKSTMATLSRFLSKEFKKMSLEVYKANVPFIVINHKRDNMDPYASSTHVYAGGNSYTHFLSVNVYLEAVGKKDTQILDDKENKIGHTIRATTEKSKFGPWPRKCEFKIDFTKGIVDVHEELVNVALEKDVISKPTSMSYEFGDQKWVGLPKLIEAVKEDSQLQLSLFQGIKESLKKKNVKIESEVREGTEIEEKRGLGRRKKNKEE